MDDSMKKIPAKDVQDLKPISLTKIICPYDKQLCEIEGYCMINDWTCNRKPKTETIEITEHLYIDDEELNDILEEYQETFTEYDEDVIP